MCNLLPSAVWTPVRLHNYLTAPSGYVGYHGRWEKWLEVGRFDEEGMLLRYSASAAEVLEVFCGCEEPDAATVAAAALESFAFTSAMTSTSFFVQLLLLLTQVPLMQ